MSSGRAGLTKFRTFPLKAQLIKGHLRKVVLNGLIDGDQVLILKLDWCDLTQFLGLLSNPSANFGFLSNPPANFP